MQEPSTGGGLGYALTKAAQTWRVEVGAALHVTALTVPQFLLLMALYRPARHGWPAPTQAEVGVRLGIDANTISQIVRGLASRGLIERRPHPDDGRARQLVLTPSGLERSRDASAIARGVNDVFFSTISDEQQQLLATLLETMTIASENRS